MKLRKLEEENKTTYTLKESLDKKPTKSAHYKFIKAPTLSGSRKSNNLKTN